MNASVLGLIDVPPGIMVIVVVALLFLAVLAAVAQRYKRCPSNRILVIYGKVGGARAAKCVHGGGVFVWPLIQDYAYLSLEPLTIDIDLTGALSRKNIRVNVPSTFTIGISTEAVIMANASERLLSLPESDIASQARDIILGQLRLVLATLSIEEINQDREKFLDLVNKNVNVELNKVGLEVINVNIRDITDESGYIDAIGKKAAAEAINQAKIEVAEAEKEGSIGEATAVRAKDVQVAEQQAHSAIGQKEAERNERISVAKLEAEGVAGEASSQREKEVAIAAEASRRDQGRKQAEREKRVAVAGFEAEAVMGENESQASIADYNAELAERRAEAQRKGEIALAASARDVLRAEKEQEIARLEKVEVAQKQIDKQKIEIEAEAEAEQCRRIARGEADAILAKYLAEAEGQQKVLEAKAKGYQQMLATCKDSPELAPTLLLLEQLPRLVETQVKAIQNLKIDKITVWDSGNGSDGGSTAGFLRGLIGSLPPLHELAKQAGIDLPDILGHVATKDQPDSDPGSTDAKA